VLCSELERNQPVAQGCAWPHQGNPTGPETWEAVASMSNGWKTEGDRIISDEKNS
jgi:hypothetical protein